MHSRKEAYLRTTLTIVGLLLVLGNISACGEPRATREEVLDYWDQVSEYSERAERDLGYINALIGTDKSRVTDSVMREMDLVMLKLTLSSMRLTDQSVQALECPRGYELEAFHDSFQNMFRLYGEVAEHLGAALDGMGPVELHNAAEDLRLAEQYRVKGLKMMDIWSEKYER